VVNHLAKMLQRMLGEDVALHLHFERDLPTVRADQGMLEQVLMNLAVNSRDAMPRGGQLIINTRLAQVDSSEMPLHASGAPGPYVVLSVGDTGSGIAPEHLPHIFEPFYTTKDVGKGTGLGLATVYGIVQQHHGWITVDSEPKTGTVFQIFLPATNQAPDTVADVTYTLPSRVGRETILLVEDEPALRNLVKTSSNARLSRPRSRIRLCRSRNLDGSPCHRSFADGHGHARRHERQGTGPAAEI
jgi:two-component system, cell cycle sensor histidine kinase and response regulator CckA